VRKLGTATQAMRAGCWNDRCSDSEVESEHTMTDATSHWDDLRRITDELQLKVHLAGLDARDRWRALEPQLHELEHELADAGGMMSETVERKLAELGVELRHLPEDLVMRLRGNYVRGW
jgi:hypothetical protein